MVRPWDASIRCRDCDEPAGLKDGMVAFYLHDALWNSIADTHHVLCFDCTQKRLGRPIVMGDLKDSFITRCMVLGAHIAAQS